MLYQRNYYWFRYVLSNFDIAQQGLLPIVRSWARSTRGRRRTPIPRPPGSAFPPRRLFPGQVDTSTPQKPDFASTWQRGPARRPISVPGGHAERTEDRFLVDLAARSRQKAACRARWTRRRHRSPIPRQSGSEVPPESRLSCHTADSSARWTRRTHRRPIPRRPGSRLLPYGWFPVYLASDLAASTRIPDKPWRTTKKPALKRDRLYMLMLSGRATTNGTTH